MLVEMNSDGDNDKIKSLASELQDGRVSTCQQNGMNKCFGAAAAAVSVGTRVPSVQSPLMTAVAVRGTISNPARAVLGFSFL